MKRLLILFILIAHWMSAQQPPTLDPTSCMTQQNAYTGTTNPNDNASYQFGYANLNPNGTNGPTHFDWVHTPTYKCYTQQNQIISSTPSILISPFHCNGAVAYNGGCGDENVKIYDDIHNSSLDTNSQFKAMDILPEDGWELIKYGFGRPLNPMISNDQGVVQSNPYIWLYNRYTGKMKFFIAITNANFPSGANPSAALIKFTTDPIGKYDLFANAKPFTHVFEDFNHGNDINAASDCDIVGINSSSQSLQYYWLYGEFTTSYDPCVCRNEGSLNRLYYEVYLTQVSNVQLTLDGTATPINVYNGTTLNADGKSVTATSINDNAGSTTGSQLVNGGKAAIKGYKDWKEYADEIKNYFNSETSNGTSPPSNNQPVINMITSVAASLGYGNSSLSVQTNVSYDYINGSNTYGNNPAQKPTSEVIQGLAGLAPLIEDVASVAPYIGAFIALTNFLTDAGSNQSQAQPQTQPAAPPTAYNLNATIKGTINLQTPLNYGSVYMPGENWNHDFSPNNQTNEDVLFPIYNNPLGVFNVLTVPNFEYKTIPMTNNGVDPNDFNLNYGYIASQSFSSTTPQSGSLYPFSNVYDYRLSGPVKYVLNPASNLSVKSIDAAIVLEYNGDDPLYIKHNSIDIVSVLALSNNPGGFTGQSTGNTNAQKQIPYYPAMKCENDPYNQSLSDPYVFSDNMASIFTSYSNLGLTVDYKTDNFTTANGTNTNTELLRVRTKYVPLQSLSAIDFMLIGSQANKPKAYLKLFCKFSKNGKPNDEPVTFVLTYDLTTRLQNATNTGTGGYGSFNYYYMKDKGYPYNVTKPGDYAMFDNLYAYGAYYSPNYGTTGPVTLSSTVGGAISAGDINMTTGLTLPGSNTGFLTYAAVTDVNMGDNVEIATSGLISPQTVGVKAGRNINVGKGFYTNAYGSGNSVTYYAGNDVTINDSYVIGLLNNYNLNMYAGNNITLNHNSNYNNIYSGSNEAYIINANLYAGKQIDVNTASTANEVSILGESVLSSKHAIPNAWVFLHNADDAATPITSIQADNNAIASACSLPTINNRPGASEPGAVRWQARKKDSTDLKIGVYPNPTTGSLNINIFTPAAKNLTVGLESLTGQHLMEQRINAGEGYSNRQVSLQDFVSGMYLLKIVDDKGNLLKTDKIILNK